MVVDLTGHFSNVMILIGQIVNSTSLLFNGIEFNGIVSLKDS